MRCTSWHTEAFASFIEDMLMRLAETRWGGVEPLLWTLLLGLGRSPFLPIEEANAVTTDY